MSLDTDPVRLVRGPPQRAFAEAKEQRQVDHFIQYTMVPRRNLRPELAVSVAWRQWCSARMLQKHIDQLPDASAETGANSGDRTRVGAHKPTCTMVHSFFACAGGFSVELDSLREAFPPTQSVTRDTLDETARPTHLTLTARGVLFLAEHGWLPTTYREEIDDKSKGNDLTKATVIIQATWMLVQVIGRLATRLPITLLEINTVAHVLCAFGMYIFWWNKPLLPTETFVLRNEKMAPLVAFMYSSSEMSGQISEKAIKSRTPVKTLLTKLLQNSTTPELESLCIRMGTASKVCDASAPALEVPIMHSPLLASIQREFDGSGATHGVKTTGVAPEVAHIKSPPTCRIQPAPEPCLQMLQELKAKDEGTAFFERRPRVIYSSETKLRNGPDDRRWQLIGEALETAPWLLSQRALLSHHVPCKSSPGMCTPCIHLKPEQLVARHIPNWPSGDLLHNVDGLVVASSSGSLTCSTTPSTPPPGTSTSRARRSAGCGARPPRTWPRAAASGSRSTRPCRGGRASTASGRSGWRTKSRGWKPWRLVPW